MTVFTGDWNKIIANRFLVKGRLGRGGMGQVFHVYDYLTYEDVALKSVLYEVAPTPQQTLHTTQSNFNFAREFQILASLRHPHIVEVYTYGFDEERQPYYVMQLLKAPQNYIQAVKFLSLKEKIALTVQMLRALLYLHHRGIVHRDIKPGNVLLSEGRLRVLDFGLATKVDPNAGVEQDSDLIEGTLAYMAPELFKGANFSIASDLYSVGIMLYEAITGQHPFVSADAVGFVTAVLGETPDLDAVKTEWATQLQEGLDGDTRQLNLSESPHAMETRKITEDMAAGGEAFEMPDMSQIGTQSNIVAIISRLLAKDPANRYQDAAEVIRDLSAAIGEEFPIETSATRESFLQASDFIGREAQFGRLTQALDQAQKGSGGVVVVSGERGIGKTRIIQELHTQALVQGNIVVIGSATGEKAYDVWRLPLQRLSLETKLDPNETAILRDVYSNLARTPAPQSPTLADAEPQDRQKRLLNTISLLLSRQKQPVVIILEDIHLAGSESLAILRHISQTISSLPLLIVATFSSDESIALNDYLAGVEFDEVNLPRFNPQQIATLSGSMLGRAGNNPHIVDYLVQQTEGNVLFMIEIIRALAEAAGQLEKITTIEHLPTDITTGGIVQLLKRRLDRIPASAMSPLRLAAVIGRRLDSAVLQHLFPDLKLEEWLNICANANVLEFGSSGWQFTHPKLRDTIQADLTADELRHLNTEAAQGFITIYPDNPAFAANIAQHWRRAGQPQKELQYTTTAADYAYRISAFDEALGHYQRLMALIPGDDVRTRLQIRNRVAVIHIMQDQLGAAFDVASASLRELQSTAPADHQRDLLADVHKVLGRIAMTRGQFQEADEHFKQALAIYQTLKQDTGIADVLINEGRLLARMGRFDDAMSNARQALALFQQTHQQWDTANTLNLLSSLYGQTGSFPEATEYALQALQTMQDIGNREGMAGIQINLGIINLMQRRTDEAKSWLSKAQAIYEEIRQFRGLASCLNNLGMIAMNEGDAASAKSLFDQALPYISEIEDPHFKSNIRVNMARANFLLGEDAVAMDGFKQVLVRGHEINAMPLVMEAMIGIGQILIKRGDVATVMRIRNLVSTFASKAREVQDLLHSLDEAIASDDRMSQQAASAAPVPESLDDLVAYLATVPSAV